MQQSEDAAKTSKPWWRGVLAGILLALAAVSLVGAIVTRYVQDNVLDTNGYLQIVAPLPQNPQVASALAMFTTSKVFDSGKAEANIQNFLPSNLAPLASPLAEALQKRVNTAANRFIQSDNFAAIWTTANRLAQKAILRVAESKQGEGKVAAVNSLDLSRLPASIRERFGDNQAVLTDQQKDKAATIKINLQQNVQQLRTVVRAVKGGAYALPYVFVALLLLALAVAYNRRRTLVGTGIALVLLSAIMLIVFKLLSGGALDDIQNATYRAAADVVYEAFYSDLRRRIVLIIICGGALLVLAILAGPYAWTQWLRAKLGLSRIKKTWVYNWAHWIRHFAARYQLWLDLAGVAWTILWLLALSKLSISTCVVIVSLLVAYVSLVHLIARPSPARHNLRI